MYDYKKFRFSLYDFFGENQHFFNFIQDFKLKVTMIDHKMLINPVQSIDI